MNANLLQNMADINASNTNPTWSSSALTRSLQYAVLNWHTHYFDAIAEASTNEEKQSLNSKLHQFAQTKLAFYLEALLLLKSLPKIFPVVASIQSASFLSSFESAEECRFIQSIFADLGRVAFNFRTQLLANPLQVVSARSYSRSSKYSSTSSHISTWHLPS
ncbi:hypothetical protein BDR26DRAFT_595804 [Obelidium mucronatum]|nr:hypothetical protein BDR26DRAFT_595804 [Obelidium mucronatum]